MLCIFIIIYKNKTRKYKPRCIYFRSIMLDTGCTWIWHQVSVVMLMKAFLNLAKFNLSVCLPFEGLPFEGADQRRYNQINCTYSEPENIFI